MVEGLFLLTFAGWALVRAYAPDKILPAGGEKYMEIAFLNGVLNSPSFPPLDPWLSGFGISYYYFGYVMMAVLTRRQARLPTIGFDLYDALLFALTAISAYGVVSSLVAAAGGRQRAASASGVLGALFVGGLGNLQGLLEGLYASRALPELVLAVAGPPRPGRERAKREFLPWRRLVVVARLAGAARPGPVFGARPVPAHRRIPLLQLPARR